MPTVYQAPLALKEIPATFMPPVIVMYNFLKYVSLETHEERSQKQFKLFYYWLSQKLVDDFPHAEKTAAAKVYLEKKIEENRRRERGSPKGSALESFVPRVNLMIWHFP